MKKRNLKGIDQIKAGYAWRFILPWVIGLVLFFAIPIIQSVFYSFSTISINSSGIHPEFTGLKNYKYLLFENRNYTNLLRESVIKVLYSVPVVIALSMVLAILLNQKFRGRTFYRALFFVPVIIVSGAVLPYLQINNLTTGSTSVNETVLSNMFSPDDIVAMLNLPVKVGEYVTYILSAIFELLWNCGIQIVLFIAGLQSIPQSFYEASWVEGATKWEEFWFITFPMLSEVTILVGVFTIVDIAISDKTSVVANAQWLMQSAVFDETSAMLWFYFIIIGSIMGLAMWMFRHFLQRRWS